MKRKTNHQSRIVATLLAIVFAIAVSLHVFSGEVDFIDVKKNDWFYESVRFVNEKGYMKGVSNTSFDPVGNLTRGMCVTILYRIAGEPETNGKNIFSDVKVKEYFTLPVIWASNNGIVYGRTETTFVPNGTITRAEFSAMLFRYISSEALSLEETRIGSPADYDKIPSYAKDAVLSMFRCGIINGREGGIFDPDTFITRAETAAMIERFVRATCQQSHNHNYVGVVTNPTCTEQGYTTYTCECGDSYVGDYTAALGHNFGDWTVTTEPTCTADGEETRTCSRCGVTETETIPATGPEDPTAPRIVVSGVEASAGDLVTLIVSVENNPGFNAFNISIVFDSEILTLNGVSLADGIPGQFGFKKYAVWINDSDYTTNGPLLVLSFTVNEGVSTEQTQVTVSFEDGDFSNYAEDDVFLDVVPGGVIIIDGCSSALGHLFGDWTVTTAPTCIAEGVEARTCSRCDVTETRLVAMAEHDYVGIVTDPTCTEDGFTTYTCSVCGDSYVADEVEALGHDFGDGAVTTAPSCIVEGVETRICSRCDIAETRPVDALGHTAGDPVRENDLVPTCLEPGSYDEAVYCTVCGKEISRETIVIDALGHDYVETVVAPTCTKGGYTMHVCPRCGENYVAGKTDALGHTLGAAVIENSVEATCEDTGSYDEVIYCTVCGEELSRETKTTEALGHEYGEWIVEKEATEDEEGLKYHVCSRCRSREEQVIPKADHVHEYEAVVTAPTCTEKGCTTYTCRCGETYVDDYADALGHFPGEIVKENEVTATCTVGAYWEEVGYCTACGEELSRETKTTEALGHDFGDWTVTTAPTCIAEGVEARTCSRCDVTETRSVAMTEHDYVGIVTDPTCTEDGFTTYTCSVCGDSYVADEVEALCHDFGDWTVTTEPTCTTDGEETRTCSRCGVTETETIPATGPEDPTAPRIVVSGVEASAGDLVTLIVSVENNPGFNAFNISIVFDSEILTLNGVSLADGIPGQFGFKKYAVWINDSDYTTNGPLLVLSFTVNESVSAKQTQVTVSFEDGDFSNYAEDDVFLDVVPGGVIILEP